MKTINIHEAKSQLSKLIKSSLEGEDIIISKAGRPLIRLIPLDLTEGKNRILGHARGKVVIDDSFFDPLPEKIEILFNQ